jgi:hypothetical protein
MGADQVQKGAKDYGQPSGKKPCGFQIEVSGYQNHADGGVQQAERKQYPGKNAVESFHG